MWAVVVFSDVCVIQSLLSTRRLTIRRTSAERAHSALILPVMRHRLQIYVWGCFFSNGIGLIKRINVDQYQKNILKDITIIGKCLVFPQRKFVFQHDCSPPHRAKSTQAFLKQKNVEVLPYPGNSPDLNPIENLWNILKNKIKSINYNFAEELWKLCQDEWY